MSEALIFASTKPQYDGILFNELQTQCTKITSSNIGRSCCVQKWFLTFRTIFVHNMFSPCSAKRRASYKDLTVRKCLFPFNETRVWCGSCWKISYRLVMLFVGLILEVGLFWHFVAWNRTATWKSSYFGEYFSQDVAGWCRVLA